MFCLQDKIALKLYSLATVLTIAISTGPAFAAKQQTLDIQARYMLLDDNKGISIYKGKVVFKKDTLQIKADTMTLYYNGKKLSKVLIQGSPAEVRHAPDNEAKVHSRAKKMEYLITEDKLILTGQAFVEQGNRLFSGESIEYDTRQRIISAAAKQGPVNINKDDAQASSPNQRVHVIIGPDAENIDAANKDSEN